MRSHLLDWQWSLYAENHTRRATLVVHLASAPIFVAGVAGLVAGAALGWRIAVTGGVCMLVAFAAQGWAHKQEPTKPVPFDGAVDFVSRFLAEQFVTFPRFVASGALGKAWRRAG